MGAADFLEIFQDTAIELQDIGVAFHLHEGASLFATDTAGAEHDYGLRLELGRQLANRFRKIPKIGHSRRQGALERTEADFVIITRVEQDERTAFIEPGLELGGGNLRGGLTDWVNPFDTEGDDFLLHLHEHTLERLVRAWTLLRLDVRQARKGADEIHDHRQLRRCASEEEINPFGGQQDRPL